MCVLVKGRGFNSHSVQYLLFGTFLGLKEGTGYEGKGGVKWDMLVIAFRLLESFLLLDPNLSTVVVASAHCTTHYSDFQLTYIHLQHRNGVLHTCADIL